MILVDTHVLIWLDQDAPQLGPDTRKRLDDAQRDGQLAVAAISFWEIAMLIAKGRIRMSLPVARWRADLIAAGLVEWALDGEAGVLAAELEGLHADPADRTIVATALLTQSSLVTADERLLAWSGGIDVVDARL